MSGEKEALSERDFFGFIRSAEEAGERLTLDIDEAEFLSGEEAVRAAMEDTGCLRERVADCVPSMNNDFYIRNLSFRTAPYPVASSASISILMNSGSPDLSSTTVKAFPALFANETLLLDRLSFRFVTRGGVVEAIEEQYTP